MPSQEAITRTVISYLWLVANGTADDVVTLYAPDATIEDPIGSDLRRGHDAIREFCAGFQDAKKETELAQLRVAGSQAAFLWHLTLDADDSSTRISPISVMRFDETPRSRRCGRSGRRRTSRLSRRPSCVTGKPCAVLVVVLMAIAALAPSCQSKPPAAQAARDQIVGTVRGWVAPGTTSVHVPRSEGRPSGMDIDLAGDAWLGEKPSCSHVNFISPMWCT
jgi:steroid Delta-isomerase